MGSSTIVYAPIGGTLVAIATGKETALVPGAAVGIGVVPGRMHLFAADTGLAVAREP